MNARRLKKCVVKLLIDVFFAFVYIPDQDKTQEMCDSGVSVDQQILLC